MHIDKIYVMAKLINMDGSSELVFICIAEQTERFAPGLFNAVFFRKLSSVCTNGTNLNSGEKNGLWVIIAKEMKVAGSTIPLTKIWCAAHRAELAWTSAAKSNTIVSAMLSTLSKMSPYFHFSGIRSTELKKIASDQNLRLLMKPKIFEVRWHQFTFTLLQNVLVSWNALVIYFKKNEKSADCAGFSTESFNKIRNSGIDCILG